MRRINLPILILALLLATSSLAPAGLAQTKPRLSPNSLVADLYAAHNKKRGPFFQTRSRALLDKYFDKQLADLIWKDARTSKGEVGVIDGDPLYDAQDMEIKNFRIAKTRYEEGRALVDVSFENIGQKKIITFILVNGRNGWKIHDLVYSEGRTLMSEFKQAR